MASKHRLVINSSGLEEKTFPAPASEGFTIYGESYCGYTNAARTLLAKHKIPFIYHEFHSNRPVRYAFAQQYANSHGTIPMVFHNARFVGGYSQLQDYLDGISNA